MRIAMFGGSFNPIHYGHIDMAKAVRDVFDIDRLLLMVANDPPHKTVADGVPASKRFEMTQLAAQSLQKIEACGMELERTGKSYTVETLSELKRLYPNDELFCVMGADMLLTIDTWYDARRLLTLCPMIAVGRPDSDGIAQAAERLRTEYGADIRLAGVTGPDISSTDIRKLIETAQPISGLTPPEVERYIYQNALYLLPELDETVSRLKTELSQRRFAHTMGVVQSAVALAARYGEDGERARLAALLHDCAKLDIDRQRELAAEYGTNIYGLPDAVIHGPIGAERARKEYGVTDGAVLGAIARHTLCGAGMTKLDKIIYLADKIEAGRDYEGVDELRKAALVSLNAGMIACIERTRQYLKTQGKEPHQATLSALEEIKKEEEI